MWDFLRSDSMKNLNRKAVPLLFSVVFGRNPERQCVCGCCIIYYFSDILSQSFIYCRSSVTKTDLK